MIPKTMIERNLSDKIVPDQRKGLDFCQEQHPFRVRSNSLIWFSINRAGSFQGITHSGFHKHTALAILASEASLCEKNPVTKCYP